MTTTTDRQDTNITSSLENRAKTKSPDVSMFFDREIVINRFQYLSLYCLAETICPDRLVEIAKRYPKIPVNNPEPAQEVFDGIINAVNQLLLDDKSVKFQKIIDEHQAKIAELNSRIHSQNDTIVELREQVRSLDANHSSKPAIKGPKPPKDYVLLARHHTPQHGWLTDEVLKAFEDLGFEVAYDFEEPIIYDFNFNADVLVKSPTRGSYYILTIPDGELDGPKFGILLDQAAACNGGEVYVVFEPRSRSETKVWQAIMHSIQHIQYKHELTFFTIRLDDLQETSKSHAHTQYDPWINKKVILTSEYPHPFA